MSSSNAQLFWAISRENVDEVRRLLAEGADASSLAPSWDEVMLHVAATKISAGEMITRLLLEHGANIEARTRPDLATPLHIAAASGNAAVVRALLAAGANVSAVDDRSLTPLQYAAERGRVESCRVLMDFGVSVDQKEHDSQDAPLLHAAYVGRADVCEFLLEQGADIAAQREGLGTALHMAAKGGYVEACRVLVAHGADPDGNVMGTAHGIMSPSQLSVSFGEVGVARFFLLECGCDPFVVSGSGFTLMELAKGNKQMLEVIRSAQTRRTLELALEENNVEVQGGGLARRSAPSI